MPKRPAARFLARNIRLHVPRALRYSGMQLRRRRVLWTAISVVPVLGAVVIAFNLLGADPSPAESPRPGPEGSQPDHLTVRYEADGRVYLGSAKAPVARLRDVRTAEPSAWRDAFDEYRQAVAAEFSPRDFEGSEPREGAVLTIVAPPKTPWRIVTWLMWPAGDLTLRIPTVRLMSRGHPSVLLHLPQDPGHTDAYVLDPPHVHVDEGGVALYDKGVIAEAGHVYLEPEVSPKATFRTQSFGPGDLANVRTALRAAMIKSKTWAFECVALTWPSACGVPLRQMMGVLAKILEAGPRILYLDALDPDEVHGR